MSYLIPLLQKYKESEVHSLKSSESHIVHQVVEWKSKFDSIFESWLNKLNSLTCDVLVSALGNNSLKEDHVRLEEYWTVLQLEIADKKIA